MGYMQVDCLDDKCLEMKSAQKDQWGHTLMMLVL